jgi:uncharacterized NAD(P)/FAD-binding protein YdhS
MTAHEGETHEQRMARWRADLPQRQEKYPGEAAAYQRGVDFALQCLQQEEEDLMEMYRDLLREVEEEDTKLYEVTLSQLNRQGLDRLRELLRELEEDGHAFNAHTETMEG